MAIEIKFLANVARFLKGTDSIEETLEEVGKSLDDVARDSSTPLMIWGVNQGQRQGY